MNQTVRIALAWVVSAFAGAPLADSGTPSGPTTPQQILSLAKSSGASDAFESLTESRKWQSSVLPGVTSAQPDWLKVAHALYHATDAGAREDLDEALTKAFLKAPYRVLPLLKEFWWSQPEAVCVFDYDSELPGGVEHYVQHLKMALDKEPPAQLAPLRSACIRGIDTTMDALRKSKSE